MSGLGVAFLGVGGHNKPNPGQICLLRKEALPPVLIWECTSSKIDPLLCLTLKAGVRLARPSRPSRVLRFVGTDLVLRMDVRLARPSQPSWISCFVFI